MPDRPAYRSAKKPLPCKCHLCKRGRQIERIAKSRRLKDLRRLIGDLHEALGHAELDLEVDEAILAGTWPSAREYANAIIAKLDAQEPSRA